MAEELKSATDVKADTTVYNQLLNAMRLCGRLEVCESLFEQMELSKIAKPDRISFNVLMQVSEPWIWTFIRTLSYKMYGRSRY